VLTLHDAQREVLAGQRRFEHRADLAADRDAQRHPHLQQVQHACLPDALAAGVHVQLVGVAEPFDRHGQLRGGGEDHRGRG
jgi:hypothetical protein